MGKRCDCDGCKKKLGILGLKCVCGLEFCSKHRQPENHGCTFDFKTNAKQKLSEKLVKVVGQKIPVI